MSFTLKAQTPQYVVQHFIKLKKIYQAHNVDYFYANRFPFQSDQQRNVSQRKFIQQQQTYIQTLLWIQKWDDLQRYVCYQKNIPKILDSLSGIKFSKLKFIQIQFGHIQNIQSIQWLQCPNLTEINLKYNKVHSIKPFKKINFDKLKGIYLSYNQFSHDEFKNLNRMKLCSYGDQKIRSLYLTTVREDIQFAHDLFKLPMRAIDSQIIRLSIISSNLIKKFKERFWSPHSPQFQPVGIRTIDDLDPFMFF